MDPETTSQPVTLNRADGSTIEFTRLSPSYRIRFRNAFRFARKLRFYENLRLTGEVGIDVSKLAAWAAKYRVPISTAFGDSSPILTDLLAAVAADAQAAGVLKKLNEFDARRLSERDVEKWVDDPEGQREAVLLSLAMKSPDLLDAEDKYAPVDAAGLADHEMHEIAAGVLNLRLVTVDDEGEKKPDPTTAGTELTGAGTQISSGETSVPAQTP